MPGAVCAILVMSPPGFGRFSTCRVSKFDVILASSVCSMAPSPVTSTVMAPLPSSSLKFTETVWPSSTCTGSVVSLKPCCVTEIEYAPGFSSVNVYTPPEPEVVDRTSPVALFFRVTPAPTMTAPEGSVTIPLTAPVTILCAETRAGNMSSKAASNAASRKRLFNLIFYLRFLRQFSEADIRRGPLPREGTRHVRVHVRHQINHIVSGDYVNSERSHIRRGTNLNL